MVTPMRSPDDSKKSILESLSEAVNSNPDVPTLTLKELVLGLGVRSHGLVSFLLALPFLMPIPLPGLSTVFGVLIGIVAVAVVFQAPIWLPLWIAKRPIPRERLVRILERVAPFLSRLETVLRPRLVSLVIHPWALRAHGLALLVAAVILALPLPPGGNAPPALVIVLMSLGLLEEDGFFVLAAYAVMAANFALLISLTYFLKQWLMALTSSILN